MSRATKAVVGKHDQDPRAVARLVARENRLLQEKAAHDDDWIDDGVATETAFRVPGEPVEEILDIRVKRTPGGYAEYMAVARVVAQGRRYVAFYSAESPTDAFLRLGAKLAAGGCKLLEDRYAKEDSTQTSEKPVQGLLPGCGGQVEVSK